MAYLDLGAVWVDYSEGTCPSGQYAWRSDPTGTGKYTLRYCSPTTPGDSFIGLSKIDQAKYDLITLNAGTQVVPKGEAGIAPAIDVNAPVSMPSGRVIIENGRVLTDAEVAAQLAERNAELQTRCVNGGGTVKFDAAGRYEYCYRPQIAADVKRLVLDPTTGQYVDQATGLAVDKLGNPIASGLTQAGMGGGALIAAGVLAIGALGYYIYKKRKAK